MPSDADDMGDDEVQYDRDPNSESPRSQTQRPSLDSGSLSCAFPSHPDLSHRTPLPLQAPFEGTDEEIAAATKLQAITRGRAARTDVRKLKDDRDAAASAAIETATAFAEAEAEAEAAAEAERALEDEFVGTEDEQAAATKLQAIQRGRLARAKVAELRAEHLNAEAQVASAEAAIEYAGTTDEHLAATRVQAVQRGRLARAQLAAEKASAAAKLADVDAKLARFDGSRSETENPDVEALEQERVEAAQELEAVATKLQAMRRGRSAREYVTKLLEEKLLIEESAHEFAATAEDADEETRVALQEELSLNARVLTGDEDTRTLVTKFTALQRVFAAQTRVATSRAEQLTAEARAMDAEADAVDAETQDVDEDDAEKPPEEEKDGDEKAPNTEDPKVPVDIASENESVSDEELWMTEEEKAAVAERAEAKTKRKAKTLHVKCAFDFAAAAATLARMDAAYFAKVATDAERVSNDTTLSVAEKITALCLVRDAREALELSQTEQLEAAFAVPEAETGAETEGETENDELEDKAAELVETQVEPTHEEPEASPSGDDSVDDETKFTNDRFEALRAVRSASDALAAAPDPDAPVPPKEYKPDEMRRKPASDELAHGAVRMHHSFGFESVKRNNLHYLSENTVVFTVGAIVQTLNLQTMEQTYLYGIDGEGVGFVVVHPDKTHFALGEKGVNPNVFIYETETLKLDKVLVGGTERAYSCGRFSNDGSKLATVGGYPDFWLTVWDWRTEAIVLRSKAFSQEVFDVTFSPFFDGQLTTSGTGHVRFWKMAETFTGLKLQGDIGRFGNEDLSDIAGYAEMPDGKVLSGTESGRLLMWDGGLIRAVLLRPGGAPCHDGMIEFIRLDADTGKVYTAGADGYVRVWEYKTLNDAEPGEDSVEAYVDTIAEYLITRGEDSTDSTDPTSTTPSSIKSLIMSEPDHWLVQDEKGGLIYVPLAGETNAPDVNNSKRLFDFHAGSINKLECCSTSDHVITAGDDGTVRLFDYVYKTETFGARFSSPACSLQIAPPNVDEFERTVVVGFGDGCVRVLLRCSNMWKLTNVSKPHNGPVTCVAYAPKTHVGSSPTLATAGADGKVWFFEVASHAQTPGTTKLQPIGFLKAPGAVTCLSWNDTGDAVLVGCETGHVFQCASPKAGSVDSTRTYEFTLTDLKKYTFKRPRASAAVVLAEREGSPPEITSEMDPADVIEAKGARKRFDERAAELQLEMDEAEASAVYPVMHLAYDTSGAFELTVSGDAAGVVFLCSLEKSSPLSYREAHEKSAITSLKSGQGSSRKLTVSGASNGTVRVSRTGLEKHWRWETHDAHRGAVTGACVSRCERYLLTTAKDGSFFVQTLGVELRGVDVEAAESADVGEAGTVDQESVALPVASDDPTPAVADINADETYSIEDAKIKVEEDSKRAAAEEEKMGVREFLEKLKQEYKLLREENELRPESEQLPPSAFEVDPGLREVVEQETLAELEKARESLAWHCEKSSLGLKKLKQWFLDDLEQERTVVRSFVEGRQAFKLTSFRVLKISAKLEFDLKQSKDAALSGGDKSQKHRGSSRGGSNPGSSVRMSRSQNLRSSTDIGKIIPEEENPFARGHKQELRRKERVKREAQWRAFNATKPDASYENPEDVFAIEVAKKTLGDYHLKSDSSHVVQEEDSMNYSKKRQQMLLLESSTREARLNFNASFFAMRDVRQEVVRETVLGAARVSEITAVLGDAHTPEGTEALSTINQPFRSTPIADEYPTEKRDEVTTEVLLEFDRARKAAALAAAKKEAAKAGGGFGGGGGGDDEESDDAEEEDANADESVERTDVDESAEGEPDDSTVGNTTSTIDSFPDESEDEKTVRELRLRHERSCLVRSRTELTTRFDDALRQMKREKSFIEGELKTAELRKLKYNCELVSLKKFEDGEASLREKLASKYAEQEDITEKSADIDVSVEDLLVELEQVNERKNKVLNEFDKVVDEEHNKREYLLKIFLRRIKRTSKDDTTLHDEDNSASDSDSDDDEYNSDDEMEESRPEECDTQLWEQILALRERRQDQDDVINDLQKNHDEFKKESKALAKKGKGVGKTLAALQEEMAEFQREKQETMNAVEMTVPLRLRQVEYLYDGKLPTQLKESVVFSKSTLVGLGQRINDLIAEKQNLRKTQLDLRREHSVLKKDTADLRDKNLTLEDAADQMQMLRFGKRIDLEKMERVMIPKKGIEELKVSLAEIEKANREELRKLNAKISQAQSELTKTTAENTAVLNAVANLTQKKRLLESRLKNTQSSVFVDPDAAKRKQAADRDHLLAVVNAQASEIDTLREEIGFLSVKGVVEKPMFEA